MTTRMNTEICLHVNQMCVSMCMRMKESVSERKTTICYVHFILLK